MFDKLTREVVSSKDYYVKGISIVAYMQKEKNLTIDPSLPGCHRKCEKLQFSILY